MGDDSRLRTETIAARLEASFGERLRDAAAASESHLTTVTDRLGQLHAAIEEVRGQLTSGGPEMSAAVQDAFGQVQQAIAAATPDLDEVRQLATALLQARLQDEELLSALRADVSTAVGDQLRSAHEGLRGVLIDAVASIQQTIEGEVASLDSSIDAHLTAFEDGTQAQRQARDEHLAEAARQLVELSTSFEDRVNTRIEDTTSRLSSAVDAVRDGLGTTLDGFGTRLEEASATVDGRLAEVVDVLDRRLPEILAGHRRELAEAFRRALEAAGDRLSAAEGELRADRKSVV